MPISCTERHKQTSVEESHEGGGEIRFQRSAHDVEEDGTRTSERSPGTCALKVEYNATGDDEITEAAAAQPSRHAEAVSWHEFDESVCESDVARSDRECKLNDGEENDDERNGKSFAADDPHAICAPNRESVFFQYNFKL